MNIPETTAIYFSKGIMALIGSTALAAPWVTRRRELAAKHRGEALCSPFRTAIYGTGHEVVIATRWNPHLEALLTLVALREEWPEFTREPSPSSAGQGKTNMTGWIEAQTTKGRPERGCVLARRHQEVSTD